MTEMARGIDNVILPKSFSREPPCEIGFEGIVLQVTHFPKRKVHVRTTFSYGSSPILGISACRAHF